MACGRSSGVCSGGRFDSGVDLGNRAGVWCVCPATDRHLPAHGGAPHGVDEDAPVATVYSPISGRPPLTVETLHDGAGSTRIVVAGEIDMVTAPQLHEVLMAALQDGDPQVIDVDLSGVPFMDSAGLNELVRLRNIAGPSGSAVRVVRPQPAVRHVFEMTGLVEAFHLADS